LSSITVVGTILISELLVLVHVKMRIFLYYKNKSGFINILKREIDTLSDSGLLIHDLFLRRMWSSYVVPRLFPPTQTLVADGVKCWHAQSQIIASSIGVGNGTLYNHCVNQSLEAVLVVAAE
jgi:hypothetical protein